MNFRQEIESYLSGLEKVQKKLSLDIIEESTKILVDAYEKDKKVIIMGNGGHAATASHFVCDITKHTIVSDAKSEVIVRDKKIRALNLAEDSATLTSWANDVGYGDSFSGQMASWVEEGDVVVAISASGNSPNILNALKVAREHGAKTIALSGYEGGKVKDIADICFVAPSNHISFIEDIHLTITHIWGNIIRKAIQSKYATQPKAVLVPAKKRGV